MAPGGILVAVEAKWKRNGLDILSTFQIFPNNSLKKMRACVKKRNEMFTEIYKKLKVGDGVEEIMSWVKSISVQLGMRAGLGSVMNTIRCSVPSREPGT